MTKKLLLVCLLAAAAGALLVYLRTGRDSHARMLTLLDEVNARTATENVFLGDGQIRTLEERLASLPAAAAIPRTETLLLLGREQLRVGETDAAIRSYQTALSLMPDARRQDSSPKADQFEKRAMFELAVAQLRRGETANCVHCQTSESCILPIQGDGLHTFPEGSQEAVRLLTDLLRRDPEHLSARWLLNIAQMTLGGYPSEIPAEFLIAEERFQSSVSFPRFVNVSAAAGLDTFGLAGGAVIDDFDGDHLLDIVVSDWDPAAQQQYFRNNGDGTFTERTEQAGFIGLKGGLNLKQADYDNDGDLDIYVLRGGWMGPESGHPNSLLQNDGTGQFRDVTFDVGLGDVHLPTQTGDWADYDNDGDLDLFVGNERVACQLFQNDGRGSFVDVAQQAGVEVRRVVKGVSWGDFDGNGFADLYVSVLDGDNRLYRNNGDGTFTNVASELKVTKPLAGFPVWFWDFDNDGVLDLYASAYSLGIDKFVADFLSEPHDGETDRLYRGDGNGGFENVAERQQVAKVTLPMGSNYGDLNGDGFLDYYLGTGYTAYEGLMPNMMFLNDGGTGFTDVTMAGGFGHVQKGHAISFADIDNDGDQDVFTVLGGSNLGDRFRNALFENPGFDHHFIVIRLRGVTSNRSAIGARIHVRVVEDGVARSIYRWINSGSSFGANPLRQHIGVGRATAIEFVEVHWPTTDLTQRFENVPVDQFIEIVESDDAYHELPWRSFKLAGDGEDTGNVAP